MKSFLLISISCLITPLVICDRREGLVEESLLFLTTSRSDHVVLTPGKPMNLSDVTLCLRFNSELRTKHTLFSYKSSIARDLLLSREDESTLQVSVGGRDLRFQLPANLWGWVHICAMRDAKQRLVSLFINGEPSVRKLLDSPSITAGGRVILGQEEDSIGREQSFVGEIVDVNLWDRVLAPRTIRVLSQGAAAPQGNVIGWLTALMETKGRVISPRSTKIQ